MLFINSVVHLNQAERDFFQKTPRKLFCKKSFCKQCKIVGHFVKEGIARQTSYNALNRRKNGKSIQEENLPGRPSS